MSIELKKWATLGVGTLALSAGLAACGGESGEGEHGEGEKGKPAMEQAAGEAGEGEGGEGGEGEGGEAEGGDGEAGEGEAGHASDIGTLPLPKRLAFMSGHAEAGLALYRAGEPKMAAKHLLHPVSETHEAERAGLDELGFDASLFEAVSQALDEGRPAAEVEPQLQAAEANLAMVAEKAGGDPAEIIRFLMDTIVDEYSVSITDGQVSDPGEYQDAYGFAIVARNRALAMDPAQPDLVSVIDDLIALWGESGAVPPADPAPVGQVIAQTSRVELAIPTY
ncbi:MAG: hypothetical protein HRU11_10590 [Parvularculaceae bacterium]|nr:hypothetical protein [Parvularculaceae bacterium]